MENVPDGSVMHPRVDNQDYTGCRTSGSIAISDGA